MTGIINIPLSIIVMTQVFAAPDGIYLGFFVVILNNMVVVLVVYHIFAITAERYLSIARPFRHRQMTKKSPLKIISCYMVGGRADRVPARYVVQKILEL